MGEGTSPNSDIYYTCRDRNFSRVFFSREAEGQGKVKWTGLTHLSILSNPRDLTIATGIHFQKMLTTRQRQGAKRGQKQQN